jgi:hypothetical protein
MSIKSAIKIIGVTVLVLLLVFAALGPAKLQLRSGLGWQIDHFVGYFALTLLVCLAWPRPLVVGGALTAAAIMLEGLQALTPDRHCDLQGALYGAGGGVAALLPADVFIRALGWLNGRTLVMLPLRLDWPSRMTTSARLLPVAYRFCPWVWSRILPIRGMPSSVRSYRNKAMRVAPGHNESDRRGIAAAPILARSVRRQGLAMGAN